MGYRSEVAIKIYGSEEEMIVVKAVYDKLYSALDAETKESVDYLMGVDANNVFSEDGFQFHADDIKWYDGYSHIEFFKDFFNDCDEIGASCEFIRIGEDYNDIVTDYMGDGVGYRLGITRMITGI
jgi:hypothetical protein